MSAHRGFRGVVSALLTSALVVGGVLLTAPAASAEETAPGDQTVQSAPKTQAPAEETSEPAQPEVPAAPEPPAAPDLPSTPEAPGPETPATEGSAAPEEATTAPELSVSPSTGLSDGDSVTVRGTGYNPAQAIYVTTCTDVPLEEVDFAFINNGCADGAKLVWQHGSGRGLEFAADGSFEVEMAVTERAGSTAMYTIANHTAMQDRSQDAKATLEFTAPEPVGPQGSATVSTASENSLTVSASLTGVDPASQPNGVHVGVVVRGTADGATQNDFLGATASVTKVPENGEFSAEVTIPGEQLDRSQQYEVVVWPRRSNPSAANIVKVLEFEVTEAQWDTVFPPAAPQATVTAGVEDASEGELSIAAKAEGVTLRTDGAQVPDTGKPDAGVYFSVIEKGTSDELAAGGQGLKAAFVWKGMMNGDVAEATIDLEAAQLDRAKEYEVYSWRAHGNMTPERLLGSSALEITEEQWDTVFPPGPTGEAKVLGATEAGLSLTANLTGLDPDRLPNGVYAGLIEAGSAETATTATIAGTKWIRSIPSDGAVSQALTVSADQLDRAKQYEVLVWKGHTNPSADTNILVLPLEVTEAQWDAVFPPATGKPELSVSPSTGLSDGDSVTVRGTGYDPAQAIYVTTCTDVPLEEVDFAFINNGCADGAKLVWQHGSGRGLEFAADGSFEVEMAVTERAGSTAMYTIANHTAMQDRSQDAKAALEFVAGPAGTATVSEANADGLDITAELTGLNAAELKNGVYVGLIEAGTAESATVDTILGTKWVRSIPADGAVSQALTVSADQLDRAKQYEVLVWKGHTNPSADTNILVLPLEVTEAQWDAVFPPQPAGPSGEAEVTAATAAGLSLTAKLTGLDPAELPQGAYVGLIEAGTAESATTDTIRGTMWIRTIPTEGEVNPALTVSAAELDRTKQYEVLVWKGHTNPSADTNILVLPLEVKETHWDAIFGPVDPDKTHISASIAKVEPGKHLTVKIEGTNLPANAKNAYVAVIEEGTAYEVVDQGTADYVAMEPFAEVRAGTLKMNLDAPAAKLVEGKRYEVLVWKQHSVATPQNIYGTAALGITQADWDRLFSREVVKPQPKPNPRPAVTGGAEQAGSLTWGVSSRFAAYVTGPIAKGTVSTSGVGGGPGGYVFPQAAGGSWNKTSQTGSVRYSGVVTFTGHKGQLNEVYANPVITVTSPSSGTISAGGHSYGLNLAAGSKSVGPNGEVTWSGVPVQGAISGGGNGGGGSLPIDPISFTVGAASGASYGSTSVGAETKKRTAAATPPATTGIRVITPAEDIVPGGEIEFEASGFESKERDVLVVLYSDPVVLDEAAGANANGVVRWIGNLPEDTELGEHTITLQGSVDAGAVIEVVEPDEKKAKAKAKDRVAELDAKSISESTPQSAGIAEDTPVWVWWAGAIALLAVAGAMSGLVVVQRRNNS